MVFTRLYVVHGIAVNREELAELFKDQLIAIRKTYIDLEPWSPELWQKRWEEWDMESPAEDTGIPSFNRWLCQTLNVGDPDWAIDIWWEFINKTDVVYTYACCSPLNTKQWVVGKLLCSPKDTDIFNSPITVDAPKNRCKSWRKFVDTLDIAPDMQQSLKSLKPHVHLLWDDCAYCS